MPATIHNGHDDPGTRAHDIGLGLVDQVIARLDSHLGGRRDHWVVDAAATDVLNEHAHTADSTRTSTRRELVAAVQARGVDEVIARLDSHFGGRRDHQAVDAAATDVLDEHAYAAGDFHTPRPCQIDELAAAVRARGEAGAA